MLLCCLIFLWMTYHVKPSFTDSPRDQVFMIPPCNNSSAIVHQTDCRWTLSFELLQGWHPFWHLQILYTFFTAFPLIFLKKLGTWYPNQETLLCKGEIFIGLPNLSFKNWWMRDSQKAPSKRLFKIVHFHHQELCCISIVHLYFLRRQWHSQRIHVFYTICTVPPSVIFDKDICDDQLLRGQSELFAPSKMCHEIMQRELGVYPQYYILQATCIFCSPIHQCMSIFPFP